MLPPEIFRGLRGQTAAAAAGEVCFSALPDGRAERADVLDCPVEAMI